MPAVACHRGRAPICLTPEERTRLATLYPPDEPKPDEPKPDAPRRRNPRSQLVHPGPRPDIRGARHGMAVLTDEMVAALRQEASTGSSCAAMARRRGLKTSTVLHAVRGDAWGWLTNPPPIPAWKGTGVTDAVRGVLRSNVLAEYRVGQLGLNHPDAELREALHRLLKRGEVERTGKGLYRLAPMEQPES